MADAEWEISALSFPSEVEKEEGIQQLTVISPQLNTAAKCDANSGDSSQKQPDDFGVPPLCPIPSGGGSSAKAEVAQERHLVELLHKASQVIKEERARSANLQQELNELRQSSSAQLVTQQIQNENRELKRELLSLHNQMDKAQAYDLQPRRQVGKKKDQRSVRSGSLPSMERGTDSVTSRPSASRTPFTPLTANTDAGGSYSDAQHRKRQAVSLQRRQLLAPSESSRERGSSGSQQIQEPPSSPQKQQQEERNQKTKQQYVAKKRASSSLSNLPFVPQKQLPNDKKEEVLVLPQSLLKSPAAEEIWQANASYNRETAYSLGMITRLRRAMAPPPTKEQLGEVIHAMVQEIVRDALRRGIGLKLTRQAPCVYLFELRGAISKKGKGDTARVVHLSIDSGRLSVKVGGGHENLLEYIERYHSLSSV
ncbi:hypothetical protein TcYC6_0024690 [Trypanosoma cruzi]|uniref:Uncharacterized protein n=1 Tax=Trypanosoma cruzi TaxID=5693 RepID=A0A7J6Y166_TRYCR|nr:hypothetical protein ECC02_006581 [Trypanosoma cruzi]KAF8289363.1 hypothetical protein TcYC6_0024690 [Trypanosoma cruzi]